MLANTSAVFRDMFQLPQPPSGSTSGKDTYDSAPLIVLHDKTADLRAFLRVVYDPMYAYSSIFWHTSPIYDPILSPIFTKDCREVIWELVGPLKLSKKYEASLLYEQLIALIKRDWPDKYKDWLDHTCYPRKPPSAEDLIHISRMTDTRNDLRFPLALAYYELFRHGLPRCNQSLLTMDDTIIVMEGYRKMIPWLVKFAQDYPIKEFPFCDRCQNTIETSIDFVVKAITSSCRLLAFIQLQEQCSSCSDEKHFFMMDLAHKLFQELPSLFLAAT
ncbi:hypothetical protein ONZ45_g11410 [Pleurotus djamor]|nr:hypothetical protein ONZ45_g11410 [Pleurotus djamor]